MQRYPGRFTFGEPKRPDGLGKIWIAKQQKDACWVVEQIRARLPIRFFGSPLTKHHTSRVQF